MDFKNASELLALCTQQQLPISEIMRRRECQLGETTRDEVTHRMKRALEIMRSSALTPLKTPVKSMGGLIGGEAKKLAQHAAKGRSICGDVLHKAAQYAMAVLEVNASMGLIVAAPTAGSAGVLPGMLFALQDRYNISDERLIDARLEEMMSLAQKVSSMVLALRRKVSIKVRQPLTKILIPVLDPATAEHISAVKNLIMNEVNVKEIELIEKTTGLITKRIKPNFKTLGPRYGKWMKQIAALVAEFSQERIAEVEAAPETVLDLGAERITVTPADFEITSEDMPGWLVASEGKLTVALDITVTEELKAEGVARELINRIQNIRKDSGFEVTDKIRAEIEQKPLVADAIARFAGYIASQTLAVEVRPAAEPAGETVVETDVDDEPLRIAVTRI